MWRRRSIWALAWLVATFGLAVAIIAICSVTDIRPVVLGTTGILARAECSPKHLQIWFRRREPYDFFGTVYRCWNVGPLAITHGKETTENEQILLDETFTNNSSALQFDGFGSARCIWWAARGGANGGLTDLVRRRIRLHPAHSLDAASHETEEAASQRAMRSLRLRSSCHTRSLP